MIRVAYPKRCGPEGWDRGEAWANLQLHQIPGAPIQIDSTDPRIRNPWRRDHTHDEWAWYYAGPDPRRHADDDGPDLETMLELSLEGPNAGALWRSLAEEMDRVVERCAEITGVPRELLEGRPLPGWERDR